MRAPLMALMVLICFAYPAAISASGKGPVPASLDPPSETGSLLRTELRAAAPVDAQRVPRLIAALDHDQFAVREQAMKDLEAVGEAAVPALRKALDKDASLEVKQRVQELLGKVGGTVTGDPEQLRGMRAVEVLEGIANAEARAILNLLAKGAPETRLTQEARNSLRRLSR